MRDDLGWACVSDCKECGFSFLGRGATEAESRIEHDRKVAEHNARRHNKLDATDLSDE